jgi:hypothetical protein
MCLPRLCRTCVNTFCLLAMHIRAQVEEFDFCQDHTSSDESIQPYTAEEDLILTEDMLLEPMETMVDRKLQEQRDLFVRMHPVMPVEVVFNHGTGEYEQKPPFGWGQ